MTDLAPEIEPLVLAVLEKRVQEAKAAARAVLEPRYAEGHKETVRSPLDGTKLGTVYRTDPDPAWTVVDRTALCAHLAQDPDNVEYVDEVAGSAGQVLAVLAEHAPHLLARVERVSQAAVDAALAAARETGTPAPGLARIKPRGVLSIRPDKAAAGAVERLVEAGWITWDGRPVELPEIVDATILEDCAGCDLPVDPDVDDGHLTDGRWWHLGCADAVEQVSPENREVLA